MPQEAGDQEADDQADGDQAAGDQDAAGQDAGAGWQERFETARQDMLEGRFQAAYDGFRALDADAVNDIDRARARELAGVCMYWIGKGYALQLGVSPTGIAGGDSLLSNRRTTSELASLYIYGVFYGIGSGGVVATYTDPDTAGGYVLPTLGLSAASAGGVYLLDRQGQLRYGVPQSISTGLLIGMAEGVAWTWWNQARVYYEDEWRDETVATLIWGASTAGGLAGGLLGHRYGTTPGRASLMGTMSLWGGVTAGMLFAAVPGNDDSEKRDDWGLLAAAFGVTGGAVAGAYLGYQVSPSAARSRFLDLGALSGGLVFGGLWLAATDNNGRERTGLLVTSAGIATGLVTAWYLTRDMEQDLPRVGAGSAGGAGGANANAARTSRWVPMVVPSSTGHGALLGVAGVL